MHNNMEQEDNEAKERPVPTGNDISDGDARDEGREDKDEDLKEDKDKGAPISKPFDKEHRRITPPSLSEPDGNHGHSVHPMGENEQRDATDDDAPDSRINR